MTQDLAALGITIDTTGVKSASRDLADFANEGKKVGTVADQITSSFSRMARQLAGTFAGLFAVHEITAFIKEITLLSSRYQELGIVMETLGRNAGRNRSELDSLEQQLRKTGISAVQSRDAIAKLMQANIDLSKATQLARLAQDAAVIGGLDSSRAFAVMIHGIQSGQTDVMRTIGLNVNWEASYKKLADQIGKNTKDLTENEKMLARVNETMEKGPAISGVYEASLSNAGKMLRTMRRYVEDLKVALGDAFQGGFDTVVAVFGDALKGAAVHADTLARAMASLTAATATYIGIIVAGQIPTAIAKIGAAMALLGKAALANPLIAAATIISGLVAAYVLYKDKLVEVGGRVAQVADYVQAAWEVLKESVASAAGFMQEHFGGIVAYLGEAFSRLPEYFAEAGQLLLQGVGAAVDGVVGHFIGMAQAIEAVMTGMRRAIAATFDNIVKLAKSLGEGLMAMFRGDFGFTAFRQQLAKNVDGSANTIANSAIEAYKRGYGTKTVEAVTGQIKGFVDEVGRRAEAIQRERANRQRIGNYGDLIRTPPAAGGATTTDAGTDKMIEAYEKLVREIEKKNAAVLLETETNGKLTAAQKEALDIMEKLRSGELVLDSARKQHLATLLETYIANDNLLRQRQEEMKWAEELRKSGEQDIQQQADKLKRAQEEMAAIGLSAQELAELKKQRELDSAAEKERLATNMESAAAMLSGPIHDAYLQHARDLREAAQAQKDAATVNYGSDMAKAAIEAAKQAQQEWQKVADAVERTLTDALMRAFESGKGFADALISALKAMFARLVLQPIIAPIAGGIADMFTGHAGSMGGSIGIGGAGASAGMGGVVAAGKTLWDVFANGFASLPVTAGATIAKVGATIGSEAVRQFGAGMTAGGGLGAGASGWEIAGARFGQAMPWLSGGLAGFSIGNMLSGNMSLLGNNPSTTTALGTAIGMAIAGPLGGAVGGALSGLANRLFGMGPKEVTATGLVGTFHSSGGSSSADVNSFSHWRQEGGWLRGNRSGEDTAPNPQAGAAIKGMIDSLLKQTNQLAASMDVGAQKIEGFDSTFRVSIQRTGDAAKDAAAMQAELQKVLGMMGDDMARFVIPGIEQFSRQGESAGQTLQRLAATFAATNALMDVLGRDTEEAFGVVGIASANARQELVDLAGGLDQLTALTASFADNYLSAEERVAIARKQLTEVTAQMGLAWVQSKEQVKELVQAQETETSAGRARMIELLKLAQSYAELKRREDELEAQARQAAAATAELNAALKLAGVAQKYVSDAMKAAGGGEQFGQNLMTYIREFNSEADGAAASLMGVNAQLMSLGLRAVENKDQFKAQVERVSAAMMAGVPGADRLYGALIGLAPAFATAANALEGMAEQAASAVKSAQQAVDRAGKAVNDAWQRVADAQARIGQIHEQWARQQEEFARRQADIDLAERRRAEDKQRQVMLDGMQKTLESLQELQQKADEKMGAARSALSDAYGTEAERLKSLADRMRDFAKSMRELQSNLLTGDLSPLTPVQQYDESSARLDELVAKARGGDSDAQAQIEQAVNDWLTKSKTLYSSSARYQQDFLKAQKILAELADMADGQADMAQSQLDALNKLIEEVAPDLIAKVVDVATAINDFKAAQAELNAANREVEAQQAAIEHEQQVAMHIEEMRHAEDLAKQQADLQREIADAHLAYQQSLVDAERAVVDAIDAAHAAEMDLMAAQDTLADAQRRHAELLAALDAVRAQVAEQDRYYNAMIGGLQSIMQSSEYQSAALRGDISTMNRLLYEAYKTQWQAIQNLSISLAQKSAMIDQLNSVLTPMLNQLYAGKPVTIPQHALGLDSVPYDGYLARLHEGERVLTKTEAREMDMSRFGRGDTVALVAEIKALRAEVAQLRAQAAREAEAMIASTFAAAERNASKVVEGARDAAREADWRLRTKPAKG